MSTYLVKFNVIGHLKKHLHLITTIKNNVKLIKITTDLGHFYTAHTTFKSKRNKSNVNTKLVLIQKSGFRIEKNNNKNKLTAIITHEDEMHQILSIIKNTIQKTVFCKRITCSVDATKTTSVIYFATVLPCI